MNNGFTGTITSTATFNSDVQTREIDFIYDHNGMRTTKIVSENGRLEITEYTLHGKLITHMTKRTVDESGAESTEELHFFYDAQSRPTFVKWNNAIYRYVHNLQGDIVGIVDNTGNLVVEYRYDAWGKSLSITGTLKTSLGELNPFGYRGYVWDEETKLYYLRSRYYNPERNRFNSVDSIAGKVGSLGTHNLFMYCANNPMLMSDPDGRFAVEAAAVGGTYGGPVGAIIGFFIAIFAIDELKKNSPSISWSKANVESVNTTQFDKAKAERYRSKLESAVFYIAYGSNFGGNLIYDENNPLNFQQTLIALGVTAAINANSNIYTSGFFQIDPKYYTNDVYSIVGYNTSRDTNWGVYTKSQMAAEGLAYMLGCANPVSEITKGTSGYEHYHDPGHYIHIWYGVQY